MHHTERHTCRLGDIARGHARDALFFGKADRGLDKVGPSFFDAQSGGHLSELSVRGARSQFARRKISTGRVTSCVVRCHLMGRETRMSVPRRTVLAGTVAGTAALTVPVTLAASTALAPAARAAGGYLLGVGISDITGPAAECGMMGYSQLEQQTAGIHLRPRARAFIIDDGNRRIVFVVADNGMIFQSVHRGVLLELARRFGDRYTEQNVLLTSIHSHATCGGSSNDYAYNLSILGFQQQVYDAEVNGIVEAIAAADADLGPGSLAIGRGELHDASVNRSRVAFERNPIADREVFPNAIDPAVTVLSFVKGGKPVGAITWFATHATSMTNQNHLISGDNKGYASFSYEHIEHGVRYLDGAPDFVAAFPQTNAGDLSPNLNLRPGSGPPRTNSTTPESSVTVSIAHRKTHSRKRSRLTDRSIRCSAISISPTSRWTADSPRTDNPGTPHPPPPASR
ncbi:hypothetical protein F5544_03565 [Nocardia arthritidis]|uniref:Neutral ceramidase n=1 Tax=Nocardia arthritidis TaxID=228602 RepID=A0A6G9Y6B4_9NOCA|nr:hypothetical protein F5544_03565 [Nocardia arthritidis]